jgi:hypothetical protein
MPTIERRVFGLCYGLNAFLNEREARIREKRRVVVSLGMLWLALVVAIPNALGQAVKTGPFGLHCGMTKNEVIQLVGERAVKESTDYSLLLATAPKPHPRFELYRIFFSPQHGLLKILAAGNDVATNGFGLELKTTFTEIQDALSQIYGKPQTFDLLRAGSIWTESQNWTMGLLKKERSLSAFWTDSPFPNHITLIMLEAKALSTEKGYVSLTYEFEGWEAFADSLKAKQDTVF